MGGTRKQSLNANSKTKTSRAKATNETTLHTSDAAASTSQEEKKVSIDSIWAQMKAAKNEQADKIESQRKIATSSSSSATLQHSNNVKTKVKEVFQFAGEKIE